MARRLLTLRYTAPVAQLLLIGAGFALSACSSHREAPPPRPASSTEVGVADAVRAEHFASEKKRADERFRSKPSIEDCPKVLHESGDGELCRDAAGALSAIEQLEPSAPMDRTLAVLSSGSLALARLSQRARYQSLVDIGERHTTGDAGTGTGGAPLTGPTFAKHEPRPARHEQHALELTDSPATRFMTVALRLERDSTRALGAYLEYAPLEVRRAAFESVKGLRAVHPQWPLLDQLIREASLLEPDRELKRSLSELAASGLPRGRRAQPPDAK